jgi:hypothetical protein
MELHFGAVEDYFGAMRLILELLRLTPVAMAGAIGGS